MKLNSRSSIKSVVCLREFGCLDERILQNSISASFVASVGNVEMPYSALKASVSFDEP